MATAGAAASVATTGFCAGGGLFGTGRGKGGKVFGQLLGAAMPALSVFPIG